jgi:FHA domain
MDSNQILLTAGVGLIASVVTALVTHTLTKAQERRKHEREVASQLAQMKSTERSETMIMAVQYGHSCFVVERSDEVEKDRVFLPMGSRITLGRDKSNHIVLEHPSISRMHAAFKAQGDAAFVEPLSPTFGVAVNGSLVEEPRRLATGDVITLPGTAFRITFVRLVA